MAAQFLGSGHQEAPIGCSQFPVGTIAAEAFSRTQTCQRDHDRRVVAGAAEVEHAKADTAEAENIHYSANLVGHIAVAGTLVRAGEVDLWQYTDIVLVVVTAVTAGATDHG